MQIQHRHIQKSRLLDTSVTRDESVVHHCSVAVSDEDELDLAKRRRSMDVAGGTGRRAGGRGGARASQARSGRGHTSPLITPLYTRCALGRRKRMGYKSCILCPVSDRRSHTTSWSVPHDNRHTHTAARHEDVRFNCSACKRETFVSTSSKYVNASRLHTQSIRASCVGTGGRSRRRVGDHTTDPRRQPRSS